MNSSDNLRGRPVLDAQGEKLGIIEDVYPGPEGSITWVLLAVGAFGFGRKALVPIDAALDRQDALCVPYTKAKVYRAPQVDDPPTNTDRARLSDFYGLRPPAGETPIPAPPRDVAPETPEVARSTAALPARPAPQATDAGPAGSCGQLAQYGQRLADEGRQLAFAGKRLAEAMAVTSHVDDPARGRRRGW